MSAHGAMRTPRWRRWASSLPVLVALLFATTTVAATTDIGPADGPGQLPMAVQAATVAAQQAAGQRPDVPVVKRGGSWAVAPDLGAFAGASARAGTAPRGWWHRRHGDEGHRAQARRETYQGRGPPGRRAPDASS